ncbi:hypothetical protein CJI97_001150 [Candidozyma auris]|uniref:1-phosphatidylinositol 4-kinase n=1 Tax=Candidozyma auris TaxID=498019 RepID=UPI000C60A695|nr:1-phosphatidylinositol 4-kinase [[Candida] auris]PIS55912.1 hypothetical protein CJI97_001150 [[Candida] auris]QEO20383.1 hypothetical_protein [[Candida] auris]GBL49645.1 putative phosphatidylinositol kinase [[Candida] auris]
MVEEADKLYKEINSVDFDVFQCVSYLRRYSDEIGVHYYLTQKLRSFKYDDLEFLIPQLLQLLISFETNSMALEDFILEYCARYTHFSLIVFWQLQAYVFELKDEPKSYSFQVVRNLINKLQDILFNPSEVPQKPQFRENLHPSLVLCGALAASIGLPQIHDYTKPLLSTQGRQQRSFVFKLANFQKVLTRNLTLKNQKMSGEGRSAQSDDEGGIHHPQADLKPERHSESSARYKKLSSSSFASDESEFYTSDDELDTSSKPLRRYHSFTGKSLNPESESVTLLKHMEKKLSVESVIRPTSLSLSIDSPHHISHSMPDLVSSSSTKDIGDLSLSSEEIFRYGESQRDKQIYKSETSSSDLVDPVRYLKSNYSKNVTEFILALQNVSLRLSQLPKEARLSALRAELSIINDTLLPAEVDIPQLLPHTSTRNKKHHKLLKLSVNEACVLNSAERVPFLMFVEFLSDEIDFNPSSTSNRILLQKRSMSTHHSLNYRTTPTLSTENRSMQSASQNFEADLSEMKTSHSPYLDPEQSKSGISHMDVLEKVSGNSSNSIDAASKTRADQMRIAAVMLQQLEASGQSTSEQSSAIKNRIIESMIALQDQFESIDYEKFNHLKGNDPDAGERKLENDFKLAEDWHAKRQRIRKSSIYGKLPNWDLCSVIAKNGSDLPQEAFACQLITMISNIWTTKQIPSWTKRMKILITSANTGLVETITNAISIHSIKKSLTEISIRAGENTKGRIFTLKDYFEKLFGDPSSAAYRCAQENFARSLASYSIICYVLQIKDRHNGNIMLDDEGHIIHIDFGFLLSNSPGSLGFEAAPFKLTMEYVDLLDGPESELFQYFKKLCKDCFKALREESDRIINMVEIMQKDSSLPCFNNGDNTSVLLKNRLQPQLKDEEIDSFVEVSLIGKSLGSMYTRLYDQFQLITQGIYS